MNIQKKEEGKGMAYVVLLFLTLILIYFLIF